MEKIDISHISELARIKLSKGEKEKFEKELSSIISFIEKLNEVDTKNIEPMTGGTTSQNITRKDEQSDKSLEGEQKKLVDSAPRKEDDYIIVSSVFE